MHPQNRPLTLVLAATLLVAFGCDKKKDSESGKGKGSDAASTKDQKADANDGKGEKDDKGAANDPSASKAADASSSAAAIPSAAGPAKIAYEAPYDGAWEEKHEFRNGLVIEDFVLGTGPAAANGSRLQIHYTGYLLDGTVFDSSVKGGRKPFALTLGEGRVIQGWDKGLVGMKQGGKRRLTIPADLAYGSSQRGKIPANSILVFTLEMIEVKAPYPDPKSDEIFKGKPLSKQKLEGGKLEIQEFAVGTGDLVAQAGDTVAVHYTGTLDNGTVFDSSVPRKSPIEFPLGKGRVIKGWDLGVAGMKIGGQRKLTIDSELGYGDRDMGKIPPKSRLTFTVELMGIDRPAPAPGETAKPEDAKPTDAKTTDTKPADTKPADTKPTDTKPTDKPVTKPTTEKKPEKSANPQIKPATNPTTKPVAEPNDKPADKTSSGG